MNERVNEQTNSKDEQQGGREVTGRFRGIFNLKRIAFFLFQYANIGGQAVIEGVMMRSPNTFVVSVRKPDGSIRIRQDQWFGLGKKFSFFNRPFIRGALMLFETMANGIISLNYSANLAMSDELKKKALKKGKTPEEYEREQKKSEKVSFSVFLTVFISLLFGLALFVFLPHVLTVVLEKLIGARWGVDSFIFHGVDGVFKAMIFVSYIWLIGFLADVRRVFQYHGAEHKSISTFEAREDLTVENARKFTTRHPRCGTSFVFFLMFISIILFSIVFAVVPVGADLPFLLRHVAVILCKVLLMVPIAGISYEIIKVSGKYPNSLLCRILSAPGMMLQALTTREPDGDQLEVALASIKSVLFLEERHNLKNQKKRVVSLEEVDIKGLEDIGSSSQKLDDFLQN